MILFKNVRLWPSEWTLDVFVAPFEDELAFCDLMHKRYGSSPEYYKEEMGQGKWVWSLSSTDESELKGSKAIVMKLRDFNLGVLVHELNHVLWHFSKNSGVQLNYDSQEWGSMLLEYLFNETQDPATYQELKAELAI